MGDVGAVPKLRTAAWAATRELLTSRLGGPGAIAVAVLGIALTSPSDWGTALDVIRGVGIPVVIVAATVFLGALSWEAWGRYWARPEIRYGEDRWWFNVTVRGVESHGLRVTVTDDHGHSVTRFHGQLADSGWVWFPDHFEVAGNKAGTKQPWGRYRVRWDVWRDRFPHHISVRGAFAWQAIPGLTKKDVRRSRRERRQRQRQGRDE